MTFRSFLIPCFVACSQVASAQVQLDRFFPAVVSAGSETAVTAEGKFPSWPVTIVCDRDDIQVLPQKDSGKLQVTVAAGTAPGVAWIRVHDKTSASKLVPMLIGSTPSATETEPNGMLEEATPVELPQLISGRLAKSGDVDTFRITPRLGGTLVVSVTAHQVLRSPMDTVLQLVDQRGNVLQQSDDARGTDPQIIYDVEREGDLFVRVFAFPETPNSTIGFAGSSSFVYVLAVTQDAFVDHVLPLTGSADSSEIFGWNLPAKLEPRQTDGTDVSPSVTSLRGAIGWQWRSNREDSPTASLLENNQPEADGIAALPCLFSGHIDQQGETDRVKFPVQKGKRYRATVHSKRDGFLLDSVLTLVHVEDGSELARNDDRARNQYDASLNYQAKQDGEVELQVSDLLDGFGPRHAYSVVIEEPSPRVSLTLAADHFVVQPKASLEIPVAISRVDGFAKKLVVRVEGLPEGVQAEAVTSEAKGDTAKTVKVKISANEKVSFQGALRIVGQPVDEKGDPAGDPIAASFPLRGRVSLGTFWLTVPSK